MTDESTLHDDTASHVEDDLLDTGLSLDADDAEEPSVNPDLALTRKVNGLSTLLRTFYSKSSNGDACADPLRGQGRVLALMAMKPETTQKELQFLLGMKQQSLSELLAKLEAKGFVTREKSPNDGRVTVVHLTEAGAAAAPDPEGTNQAYGAYDCLDEKEREQFEQFVDRLDASLKEKLGDAETCEHGHEDDGEGEQKRHRYGQQGRTAFGTGASAGAGRGKGGAGNGHGKGGNAGAGRSNGAAGAGRGKEGSTGAGRGKGGGAGAGAGRGKGGHGSSDAVSSLINIAGGLAGLGSSSKGGRGRGGRGNR